VWAILLAPPQREHQTPLTAAPFRAGHRALTRLLLVIGERLALPARPGPMSSGMRVLGLFVDPAVDRLAVAFGLTDVVELMLAWRGAGYYGLDHYLLPLLDVP